MFGIGFVCFMWEICWALGLSVSFLRTYVWHCICLFFVGLMLCIGFVCYFVGGLMFGNGCVIWNKHS